jgi:hypothetical protein
MLEAPLDVDRRRPERLHNEKAHCYGLLCGYEDGQPKCLRITCTADVARHDEERLQEVRPIGQEIVAIPIQKRAIALLQRCGNNLLRLGQQSNSNYGIQNWNSPWTAK